MSDDPTIDPAFAKAYLFALETEESTQRIFDEHPTCAELIPYGTGPTGKMRWIMIEDVDAGL
jgi:hypothetical protein